MYARPEATRRIKLTKIFTSPRPMISSVWVITSLERLLHSTDSTRKTSSLDKCICAATVVLRSAIALSWAEVITEACSPRDFWIRSDDPWPPGQVLLTKALFWLIARLPRGSFAANSTTPGTALHSVNPTEEMLSFWLFSLFCCVLPLRWTYSKETK